MTTFDTYCGLCCESCEYREPCKCGGCIATKGKPFHGECKVATCATGKGRRFCGECESFPCDLLKSYSYDAEQGDNGARIEKCKTIKAALVAEAREGVDPVAYCGFSCNNCFLGEWCGSCRSAYNCCSYATICEGGVCPQVTCCQEHGYDGCWECDQLDGCKKGYFSKEADGEYACKAQALFVRAHGKEALLRVLEILRQEQPELQKFMDQQGGVAGALKTLESRL